MSAPPQGEAEKNIEIWKVKKLIKRLESARGNGTSMISLIIRECPPQALHQSTLADRWDVQRPKIKCREQRKCWQKNSYVIWLAYCRAPLTSPGYRVEYQISGQSPVRIVSHHIYAATPEAVQQGSP